MNTPMLPAPDVIPASDSAAPEGALIPFPGAEGIGDSAANMPEPDAEERANDPRQAGWREEIHRPAATYNGNVPVDAIERDPGNRTPLPGRVRELATTIEAEGLQQPIVLRDLGGGRYRIIAGETRWLAFRRLERATIPAMIHAREAGADAAAGPSQGDVTKRLIENLSRTDLNPIDEARGFRELAEAGKTQKEIGALFGRSQPAIANAMRMLALPDEVLGMIEEGELSAAHGVSLARFARWPRIVTRMAEGVVANLRHWTAKDVDRHEVPFAYELARLGWVIDIKTRGSHGDRDPVYVVPSSLAELPEFIQSDWCCYYMREPGTEDLWTPEKARQDAARAAVEKAKAAKDAKAVASGKKTREQVEREKKLAANRQTRADVDRAYDDAMAALAAAKEVSPDMLSVLIAHALHDGRVSGPLGEVAKVLGVEVPKSKDVPKEERWKERINRLHLMGGGPVLAAKLAVGAILRRKHEEGHKFLSGVAAELRLIAAAAPALTPGQMVERAAKRAGLPAAKLVVVAHMLAEDVFQVREIAAKCGLKPQVVKVVEVALETDSQLGAVCAQLHEAARLSKEPEDATARRVARSKHKEQIRATRVGAMKARQAARAAKGGAK